MKFLAILRDSFREAVDGFVIYVMLALSGLFLLLLASLSFTPALPDKVLPDVLQRFVLFLPDRGDAKVIGTTQNVEYTASNIRQDGSTVTFRLTAKAGKAGEDGGSDTFRHSVAAWTKAPGETLKMPSPKIGNAEGKQFDGTKPEMELARPITISPSEAAGVDDPLMADYLKNQFYTHLGVSDAEVGRTDGPTGEREYAFDVTLPGATSSRGWTQELSLFFGGANLGEVPLGGTLYILEDYIVNGIGAAITLMIAVIITAFFIPNMLRKGSMDLYIAKPIGRSELLIYKYLGGLIFIFLLSVVNFGGTWVVLGLRSGHWDPRFLLAIPVLTFSFALLYAMSTMVAVFTRSAIASIVITLGFAFLLYVVGKAKSIADELRAIPNTPIKWPDWVYTVIDGLNAALPRYKDLDKLMSKVTADGTQTPLSLRVQDIVYDYPSWSAAIGVTVGYIAVMLTLSCWRLSTRDG